jgi:hypothetical protein
MLDVLDCDNSEKVAMQRTFQQKVEALNRIKAVPGT